MPTQQDPRVSRLIQIDRPGQSPRVIGVAPVDQDGAVLVRSSVAVASAMSTLSTKASEIINATQLLPSERASRLAALQGPAVEAARAHLQTLAAEQRRIEGVRAASFPVQRGDAITYHKALMDQLLLQRLAALDPSKRNIEVSRAVADPQSHPDLIGAVLRAGREVLDLPASTWSELHTAAMAVWRPDELANLEALEAQLELAQRAAMVAQEILAEALPGAAAELKKPLAEPTPEPTQQPAHRGPLTREEMLARLPAHILADLTQGGRIPSPYEVQLAAARSGTQ